MTTGHVHYMRERRLTLEATSWEKQSEHTHSFFHSLPHSVIHSFICSLTHPFTKERVPSIL